MTPEGMWGPVNTQVKAIFSCVSAMLWAWRRGTKGQCADTQTHFMNPRGSWLY